VFHTFAPYVVPEILERLATDGHKIELKLLEGDQRTIVDGLKAGEIDIALLYDLDLGREINVERLAALDPYVLLAADDPLTERQSLSLSELSKHPLILLDAPPSGDYFVSLFRDKNLIPDILVRSTSFEMVRGIVGRGMGYSLLATKPASNMSYDGRSLTTRPLRDETSPSHIALAKHAGGKLNPAANLFAAECRIFFREFNA
jgi:DNA-binding transcriptional LysR family regulator